MKKEILKQEILRLLNEGYEITVTWDCGGDESFLTVYIDGHKIETRYYDHMMKEMVESDQFIVNGVDIKLYPKFDWDFIRLLLEEVDILEYSDFSRPRLEGGGKVILQDNKVLLEFKTYRTVATEWENEENIERFGKMPDFSEPEEREPNKKLEIPLAQILLFQI